MYVVFLTCCMFLNAWMLSSDGFPTESKYINSVDLRENELIHGKAKDHDSLGCEYLDLKDVEFLENGNVLIVAYNISMESTESDILADNTRMCFNRTMQLKRDIFEHCHKWLYESHEFKVLDNGSVLLLSAAHEILEPGTYEIDGGNLHTCFILEDYDENSTFVDDNSKKELWVSVMFGRVGSSISIVALTLHLIVFCIVPPLRNLPGYNLASLSIAFLVAFSNVVIGQMEEVIGLSCVISGILQIYCFLVAFFCTNVMAFDVWRTLRMATSKLAVNSDNKKKILFIIYTIYSWGVPLVIIVITVILDNVQNVPSWIKPGFGVNMTCQMTNIKAKIIFFLVPAFTIFMVNGVFFVLSALMIKNNTMKNVNDQRNQTVRLNFVLYVRLGLMMGVTWLFSLLANVTNSNVLWRISDFLNPLQGLFIFILFTCSPKVLKYFKQKFSLGSPKTSTTDKKSCSSSDKHTTNDSTATTKETTFSNPKPVCDNICE